MGVFAGVTTNYLLTSPNIPQSLQKYILWAKAREGGSISPSLDLYFSENKNLIDNVSGENLINFTRASSGTYVGSDGLIKTATTNYLLWSEEFDDVSWFVVNSIIDPNTEITPNGALTADKQTHTGGGPRISRFSAATVAASSVFTFSFYAKAGTSSFAACSLYDGTTSGKRFWFNLSSGTPGSITNIGAGYPAATSQMQSIGNGWYRCIAVITNGTNTTVTIDGIAVCLDTDGILTPSVSGLYGYIWGAQLEQSSTVGEYIPTTSTINSAPRFDHDPTTGESLGLLVEEQRVNNVLQSEALSTSPWGIQSSPTITPNNTISPSGDSTADLVAGDGVQVFSGVQQVLSSLVIGNTYVVSSFIKPNNATLTRLGLYNPATPEWNFYVDTSWSSGVPSTSSTFGSPTNIQYQNYGNGWYRCSFVGTVDTTTPRIIFQPDRLNVGASSWVWGVSVESGNAGASALFPTSYIPTEGTALTRSADLAEIAGNNFGDANLLKYSEEFDNASAFNVNVTPNVTVSPDGKLTADAVDGGDTTNNLKYIYSQYTTPSTGVYTYSVYLKYKDRQTIVIRTNDNTDANGVRQSVDLLNGTLVGSPILQGTASNADSSIVDVGNNWYRVSVTCRYNSALSQLQGSCFLLFGNTTDTNGFYIWGAQLEKSSTVGPYVKSKVTWNSRLSNATYYDATGTLKKSSYNLLTYSEDFTNTIWTNISTVTITSSTGVDDPKGTNTAATITNVSGPNLHRVIIGTAGIPYTYSIWIRRRSGTGPIYLSVGDNGLIPVTVTDTWTRISETSTPSTSTVRAYVLVGTTGNSIDVWGAQLETGTYAGDYVKTEASAVSSARTNAYLPDGSGNFVSAGELLLEDVGTNLIPSSEEFETSWNTLNSVTVDPNTEIAPNGTLTADKIIENTTTSGKPIVDQVSYVSGATYTASIYLKPAERPTLLLHVRDSSYGIRFGGFFNTTTGVFTPENTGGAVLDDYSFIPVKNGWYRCSITGRLGAVTSGLVTCYICDGSNSLTYQGDGASGFYLWGAQLEEGSFPTSYIPTFGSEVTRSADVSTSTSGFLGNSWYNDSEGTMFSSFVNGVSTINKYPYSIDDGSTNNRFNQFVSAGAVVNSRIVTSSVSYSPSTLDLSGTGPAKIALAAEALPGGAIGAIEGSLTVATSPPSMPIVNQLFIGSFRSLEFLNGHISRLTYWQIRLPNDILQTITQ